VVGYSRLMGEDEAGTLDALKTLRKELVAPEIAKHKGRIVKLMGDGLLAEFGSVVEAVECAVAIQTAMPKRNAGMSAERGIQLRIGINLGDVIVEGGDIYGDGVNVAARLEGLAAPGGICIADRVHEQVESRLDCHFTDAGEQTIKNIARPIRIWRWSAGSAEHAGEPRTGKALPLPDKPSIAVLPFTNMSGDPEQEYFSDGITEDIITELSRFRSLFVIARNSSFTFKGKAVDVKDIGERLGVAYIVEGSVRKAGNRVRVTAQLVEAATGNHLWAERYDRQLEDIFEVQDDVVKAVVGVLPAKVNAAIIASLKRRHPESLTAYELLLRAQSLWTKNRTDPELIGLLEQSLRIDGQSALAHGMLALAYALKALVPSGETSIENCFQHVRESAHATFDLDDSDALALAFASQALMVCGDFDESERWAETAATLNPNDSRVLETVGCVLNYLGKQEEAVRLFHDAERLDPADNSIRRENWSDLFFMSERYEKVVELFPGWKNLPDEQFAVLAAAHAQLGHEQEARTAADEYLRRTGLGEADAKLALTVHLGMCRRAEDRQRWLDGYRKAGLVP